MTNTADSLDTIITRVNKKLGEGTLIRGRDLKNLVIPRITSGAPALDLSLGGGWPMNCWCEIAGEPSNGKSVLAMKTVAANQAVHRDFHCLWIAAEQFVPSWAQTCGCDMDRMTVAETQVMEEAYQIVLEVLENRAVDAVVIDSLSSLVPIEEDEKAMDDWQVALGARITGKFMRKSNSAQRRSMVEADRPCLGLIISQWREKVGVQYGDNRVTPYGRAKEFFYMTRVEVRRDEWLGSDKHKVGLSFKTRTVKNKTAPPQRVAAIDFYWEDHDTHAAGSYDVGKQFASIAIDMGLIQQAGGYYRYAGRQWQGKEKLYDSIEHDPALQIQLEQDIVTAVAPHIDKPKRRTLKRA